MTARNTSRVPKKAWAKWSDTARRTFNEVYKYVHDHPDVMQHTSAPAPNPAHWKVLAWNCAWIAADAVDDALPEK